MATLLQGQTFDEALEGLCWPFGSSARAS